MIDTDGEISSPNVPSGTGGTKSKSKSKTQIKLQQYFHDLY